MLNKIKYKFSDFTHAAYKELLILGNRSHVVKDFRDFHECSNFIIWRHDIDTSMNASYKIAKIEYEEGISSTFFIHLHNRFYHFWEAESVRILKKIMDLGHQIGLHFDCHFFGNINSETVLEELLLLEKQVLERALGIKVKVFSFHNPTNEILKFERETYVGMVNTYSSFFKQNVVYTSDSNGYWRYRSIKETIEHNPGNSIQVLTHPEWWTEKVMSPKEKIWSYINQRAENTKIWYESTLQDKGRKLIDW